MTSERSLRMITSDKQIQFTTESPLQGKFSAFALFVHEYSFQIYCLGNSFMQNFVTLQFQNQAWWWNLLIS